jgi:hypothetical protein
MPYNAFRPKPGRHGIEVVYLSTKEVNALTSASTDTIRIPTPFRRCYFLGASVQTQVVPIVTTGTSTATVRKFQASDGTSKNLTAGFDLETLTANKASPFSVPATIVESDKFIRNTGLVASGDTLFVDFVNGTTIATAPTALYVVVELAVLN